jgi:hypothetical protein
VESSAGVQKSVEARKEGTGQGAKQLEGARAFYDMRALAPAGRWIVNGSASDARRLGRFRTRLVGVGFDAVPVVSGRWGTA